MILLVVEAQKDEYEDISIKLAEQGYVVQILFLHLSFTSYEYVKDLDFFDDVQYVVNTMYQGDVRFPEVGNEFPEIGGSACVIGHGIGADLVLQLGHPDLSTSPFIKGFISVAPGLRIGLEGNEFLKEAARDTRLPNLIIGHSEDSKEREGMKFFNLMDTSVCRTYVNIIGGNHCFLTDLFHDKHSQCIRDEFELNELINPVWKHKEQLLEIYVPLFLEFFHFLNLKEIAATVIYGVADWKELLNNGTLYLHNGTTLLDLKNDLNMTENSQEKQTRTRVWSYLFSCWQNDTLNSHDYIFPASNRTARYRLFGWRDPEIRFEP